MHVFVEREGYRKHTGTGQSPLGDLDREVVRAGLIVSSSPKLIFGAGRRDCDRPELLNFVRREKEGQCHLSRMRRIVSRESDGECRARPPVSILARIESDHQLFRSGRIGRRETPHAPIGWAVTAA